MKSKVFTTAIALLIWASYISQGESKAAGSVDENCPVLYGGKCYKMFTAPRGAAFTWYLGELLCENLDIGFNGHLANVYGEEHFKDLIAYMLKQYKNADPNVLLGMTYNRASRKVSLYGGNILSNPYWGVPGKVRPLRFGHNMIIRASERSDYCKLQNFGGDGTRYKRVMCEYERK